jgi:hypothetical protein
MVMVEGAKAIFLRKEKINISGTHYNKASSEKLATYYKRCRICY